MTVSFSLLPAGVLVLAASACLLRWRPVRRIPSLSSIFPFRASAGPAPDGSHVLHAVSQRREDRAGPLGSASPGSGPGLAAETELARREVQRQAVASLLAVLHLRDLATAQHARRTAALADALARTLELDAERREGLYLAALVHDIGQIQVPAEILARPRRLSAEEFDLVRMHPEAGHRVLRELVFSWPVAEIVHQHHENVDGSGFPRQLRGGQLLLEARILRVADSCTAMLAHRPFRRALPREQVIAILEKDKGTVFDEQVADACLDLLRREEEEALFSQATEP